MHATPAYDLRPNRSSYSEPKCCESGKDPLLDLTLRAWILLKGVNMGVFERTDIVAGGRQASAVINVRFIPNHSHLQVYLEMNQYRINQLLSNIITIHPGCCQSYVTIPVLAGAVR